jgi:hypothetical protein
MVQYCVHVNAFKLDCNIAFDQELARSKQHGLHVSLFPQAKSWACVYSPFPVVWDSDQTVS